MPPAVSSPRPVARSRPPRPSPFTSRRGSVLLIALILAAVIAISLVSFLNLGNNAASLSNRIHYAGVAMNASETGLEYAMASVNKKIAGSEEAWSGWTTTQGSAKATRTYDLGTIDGGAAVKAKVYVSDRSLSSNPVIVSRSIVTPVTGPTLEKWVEVKLHKRSKFANGLVSKDSITFSGNNATVDSWNSDPNGNGSPIVAYSSAVRHDKGSVGSISILNDAVLVNNADIWGSAATGGMDPTTNVGNNGSILGADSATKDTSTWTKSTVDPDRISTDFTAAFDTISTPTSGTTVSPITSGPAILGAIGTKTTYRMTSVSLSGNSSKILTILGDVTLILTATSGNAMSLTGNASIAIPAGSSLTLYSSADLAIGGNGVANANNQPKTFVVYGTATDTDGYSSTTEQTIDIKGNGALKGVVYAPNATVNVNGNGDVMGSVVAGKVRLTGNANFHYDESLANFDSGDPYGISEWLELVTTADRSTYASQLDF